ncbi:MAG: glycosyltransferase [Actinomycetota bacterium]|nr:glycosyltransferase [Actinomycetota bacterium]
MRSVLAQQDVVAEVLVINDGGDSATAALIEEFADARVRLLVNTGAPGVSGARNTGIAAATGDWVAFLDDDDLWAPGKLAAQLAVAEAAGAGWVYAGDVTVDAALRVRGGCPPPPPEEIVQRLRAYNAVPAGASNVAVRREVLAVTGGFDPGLRTSEDWDLWLRLAATGLPAYVPRPLVALRTHPAMASRAVKRMLADIEIIADRHGIAVDRPRHQRWAAWICLEDGNQRTALRHYAHAVAEGDLMSLGRAAVALVAPGLARRRRPDPADRWVRQAQTWLDALRDEAASAAHREGGRSAL